MQLIETPHVEQRPQIATLGIRLVTPFRGMLAVRDDLMRELRTWLDAHGVTDTRSMYFRFYVVNMDGDFDLEVGVITASASAASGRGRVRRGEFPPGRYATLTYVDHSLRANRTLIEWAATNGLAFDRRDHAQGDAFACRYEAYLTDERVEKRKTRWQVQLNIKLAD